jgi:hypothetical protein
MYEAKQAGRDRVVVVSHDDERAAGARE